VVCVGVVVYGEEDPSELLPLLCPCDWPIERYAVERLIPGRPDSPYVVLGWDQPAFVLIAQKPLVFDDHRATALQNLREQRGDKAEWTQRELSDPSGSFSAWVREGDWFTASDLLDREFLRAAATIAGVDTVYFATPTRECMIMAADDSVVRRLAIGKLENNDDNEFVVGAQVYRFDESGLVLLEQAAVADSQKAEPPAVSFDTAFTAEAGDTDDGGYVPLGMSVPTPSGETMVVLPVSEPSAVHVTLRVKALLAARLEEYAQRPEFGGRILFMVNPEAFGGDTPAARAWVENLIQKENRALREKGATTISGGPILLEGRIFSPEATPRPTREVEAEPPARARDPEKTRRMRELALVVGAALSSFGILLRWSLASTLFPRFEFLMGVVPIASLAALLLALRGWIYGRFIALGLSGVFFYANVVVWNRGGRGVTPVWVSALTPFLALVFAVSTVALFVGRERRRAESKRSHDVIRAVIGLGIGIAAAFVGFSPGIYVCETIAKFPGEDEPYARPCSEVEDGTCAKIPGCRPIAAVCAPLCVHAASASECRPPCAWRGDTCAPGACRDDCWPAQDCTRVNGVCTDRCSLHALEDCRYAGGCWQQTCEGTPTKPCGDFSASECPRRLCRRSVY
jgi:hypothetical protein